MRFYEPAESQPCYYCKKFKENEESDYPLRDAVFTYEKFVYRCSWHSQFACSKCGKTSHFSWFYWCPEKKELICGDCSKPRLHPVKFWDRTYAYEFFCESCNKIHYDILYTEFCGEHPWQLGVYDLKTALGDPDPWEPMWSPEKKRSGEPLSLEESLKLENRVFELRRDLNVFEPIGSIVSQSELKPSKTQDAWEEFSAHWLTIADSDSEDEGDPNRRFVIDPTLMKLLGPVDGLKILDAGCGNGYLSRKLASLGAIVTGVDFTEPFIEYCNMREVESPLGCTFIQASLDDLSFLNDGIFDLVVSNVVMADVVNYQQAFLEISRVLRNDGRFIWSNTHPVFGGARAFDIKLPRDSHRQEERYLKLIDRYFDSGGILINWDGHEVWQIDRTLEEYSKALKEAGLVISEIVEPRPTPEMIQENPRFLAFDADRWTHFIIFECLKRKSDSSR
ncbi:MAG: class I SAM-dependent methyltransferase [Candidatus Thorarchaeota archaeon]|nr:class I SAM-dependent methyltransferase [Candidatus Thorarchaeota archaeon]